MSENAMALIALVQELELVIQGAVPEAVTVSKYGGTLYTLSSAEKEGQFCGLFVYSNHAQISFSKGAALDDPDNLLSGSGKLRRHINFHSIDDINDQALEGLLIQASGL